jgi:hypothetical protein
MMLSFGVDGQIEGSVTSGDLALVSAFLDQISHESGSVASAETDASLTAAAAAPGDGVTGPSALREAQVELRLARTMLQAADDERAMLRRRVAQLEMALQRRDAMAQR